MLSGPRRDADRYLVERWRFPGRAAVAALLDLPLSFRIRWPASRCLLVLGRGQRRGRSRAVLRAAYRRLACGIVAAMLFVSAPLYISGAREAFARVDRRYEAVARTLGDPRWRVFRRVTLPLSAEASWRRLW
jgi:ABC-type sulfate transport system permease component